MVVYMESGDGAEVDHGKRDGASQARSQGQKYE